MKIAVLAESSADEAAIRILIDGILEVPAEIADLTPRARGWSSVLTILPSIIKSLHYHTDTDGLVAVVDSDLSPPHTDRHDEPGSSEARCRLCSLTSVCRSVLPGLRPVANRPRMNIAVGLAVPCVEAWYSFGRHPHVGEAQWRIALESRRFPYDPKRLKEELYGRYFSLEHETRRAVQEARRLVPYLNGLEQQFPQGFGTLAREVRAWRYLCPDR